MQRYSKKRQAILDCLRGTTSHPTAEWVFERLRPSYPDLSLATVYRNLGQLKAAGIISSRGVIGGHEHFDARTDPHTHAVCSQCGAIVDVEDMPVSEELVRRVEQETGYQISEAALQFTGICKNCRMKTS